MLDTSNQNSIDFSIIIPARNEESNIVSTIKETVRVFEGFNPRYEIIIIDDGSTDKTYENVKEFIGTTRIGTTGAKISIETYRLNQGKGYALKYGASLAHGQYILFLDADLDLHPAMTVELYRIMLQKQADVVIGSKMHKKSVLNYPFLRKLASYSYYIIIKTLFALEIKDTQTGIKLFKHDVLVQCLPRVLIKRYAFDLELLVAVNKKGYKISEAPVHVDVKRQFGRVTVRDVSRVFFDTIGVFGRLYFKKYYD